MGLPWFLAWCVVGVLLGFGVSQTGLFTVPTGALLALVLVASHHAGRQALGLVALLDEGRSPSNRGAVERAKPRQPTRS